MERVPAYLVVYLLKIRKHSGESGYLERRLEGKSQQRAVYEKAMLEELSDLHLIAVTDKEHDIVLNPIVKEVEPDFKWFLAALFGGLIARLIG